MNKDRRNKISGILSILNEVAIKLNSIYCEEELAFDSIPENLQGSLRSETIEEGLEILDEAIDDLNNAREKLEDLI